MFPDSVDVKDFAGFMKLHTLMLELTMLSMQQEFLDKHYRRKPGTRACYGQIKELKKEIDR